MDIASLNQELTEKIDSLQNELDVCKRQKEVITIIESLKSIRNFELGYSNNSFRLNISCEGFANFVSLLDSTEYLKGYNNGGNFFGENPKRYNYDIYYLTLGKGIVLKLSFCQTEIEGYVDHKKSYLSIQNFMDSQDLRIEANASHGHPRIEILKQDGDAIFGSDPTTDEYLKFNNQNLNEALMPISADNLANRFFEMLQKTEEYKNKDTNLR